MTNLCSVEEKRREAVAYMYLMSQIEWICKEDIDLSCVKNDLIYKKGEHYKGVIYNTHYGNALPCTKATLEVFKENLDENGVYVGGITHYDVAANHCSSTVINTYKHIGDPLTATWTMNFHPARGTGSFPVGEFKFDPADTVSAESVARNSEDTMFRSYAALLPGDFILSCWGKTGHTRLVESVVTVKKDDGTLDPDLSTVVCIEQTWNLKHTDRGITTWRVFEPYSFRSLLEKNYMPLTVATLLPR